MLTKEKRQQIHLSFLENKSNRKIHLETGVETRLIYFFRLLTQYGFTDWIKRDKFQKFTTDFKITTINEFREQNLPYIQFAAQKNIHYEQLKRWIRECRGKKPEVVFKNKLPRQSSMDSELASAVIHIIDKDGVSNREVADTLGISMKTVQRWMKRYRTQEEFRSIIDSYPLRSREDTMSLLKQKALENKVNELKNWIRQNKIHKSMNPIDRIRDIQKLVADGFNISEACSLYGIHRSTYYRMLKRDYSEDMNLSNKIRQVQKKYHYSYGAKRMAHTLANDFGQAVNHKRVARLMRIYGLNATTRRRKKFKIYRDENHPVCVDLVQRRFTAKEPGKKLVTDMTFFHVREGWLVLNVIKDLFNNEILAWDFDTGATLDLALATLRKMPNNAQLVLHSDQGTVYTSNRYRQEAEAMGIQLSYSRRGNCYDNAAMENFFGHLKSETIYQMRPEIRYTLNRDQLKSLINTYIKWYNTERIQRNLSYLSPIDYREKKLRNCVAL